MPELDARTGAHAGDEGRGGRVVVGCNPDDAIEHLCHALALPPPSDQPFDARQRADSLASIGLDPPTPEAKRAFTTGVTLARAGRAAAAADAFHSAVVAQPAWPDARYNLGVILGDLGRHEDGALQLQEYLTLSPRAADAASVARVIGRWEATNDRVGRGTALGLGLAMPGMGQFYTGRPSNGLAILAAAGGAIAAGFLVRRVDVRCLDDVAPGQSCSPGRVVSRRESRPYLSLSIAAAGAVTVLGALDAYYCWTCREGP